MSLRRVLGTIDRWGPAAVAVLTLFGVAWFGWVVDSRTAKLEGLVLGLQHELGGRNIIEASLRMEVQTWQAHTVALRQRLAEAGYRDLPPLPKPATLIVVRDNRGGTSNKSGVKQKQKQKRGGI